MIAHAHQARLSAHERAILAMRIWAAYAGVRLRLHRKPLPDLVEQVAQVRLMSRTSYSAQWLGRAVRRALPVVARDPTCLVSSLVLMSLLRAQGDPAVLVIGLPPVLVDERAHAWVELDGMDVGPPPGRGNHVELARYGE